jgi:hypothetical protein
MVRKLCPPAYADGQRELSRLEAYLPDFFAVFFTAFLTALAGGFAVPLTLPLAAASSGISLPAMGDPSPEHASHPGPAEKAPLLPWVMSLKAEAALAA